MDVNGQVIPRSPLQWGESLISAVQFDLTQWRAVKNVTRRVAENTNATGVRLECSDLHSTYLNIEIQILRFTRALSGLAPPFLPRDAILSGRIFSVA